MTEFYLLLDLLWNFFIFKKFFDDVLLWPQPWLVLIMSVAGSLGQSRSKSARIKRLCKLLIPTTSHQRFLLRAVLAKPWCLQLRKNLPWACPQTSKSWLFYFRRLRLVWVVQRTVACDCWTLIWWVPIRGRRCHGNTAVTHTPLKQIELLAHRRDPARPL